MTSGAEPRGRGRASLPREARELMVREHLFAPGSRSLVMVSGGQDSMALLHLLATGSSGDPGPASVHVLHVNHHLRGEESEADQALVERFCERLEVGLTVVEGTVDKTAGNVQEWAREERRRAAVSTARKWECETVALGHTLDDQVETMLYRLGRYGGLAAFRGMLPRDPPWVRPLLSCRREETAAYCREQGMEFVQDSGNAYPGYARTGIREQVMPAWEATLPGAVEAAARAAEVAAEIYELIAAALGAGAETPTLSVSRLLEAPAAVRRLLLHRWLEERARPAASRAGVLAVEALLRVPGSADRDLAGGWRVSKEYDCVSLERGPRIVLQPPEAVDLPLPGEVVWDETKICAERVERFQAPDSTREAYVDARCVTGPLRVRGPLPGDRMRPLGSPGTRKLQDVMVDLRVPASRRARTPLVVCGSRVIWVCGLVVAEEGRIGRDTTAMVRLELISLSGSTGVKKQADGKDRHE